MRSTECPLKAKLKILVEPILGNAPNFCQRWIIGLDTEDTLDKILLEPIFHAFLDSLDSRVIEGCFVKVVVLWDFDALVCVFAVGFQDR